MRMENENFLKILKKVRKQYMISKTVLCRFHALQRMDVADGMLPGFWVKLSSFQI